MQCYFKLNKIKYIDYKDLEMLRKFITPAGKIMSARRGGVCRKNQNRLATSIKQARFMGLLPYIQG